MAVGIPAIREVVERVFARQDVLDACRRHDLGAVISVLCAHGVTQGQIAGLTCIPQGRLSEHKTGKRIPTATSTFEGFADGLGLPPAARLALGLAPEAAGSRRFDPGEGRSAETADTSVGNVQPLLSILSRATGLRRVPDLPDWSGKRRWGGIAQVVDAGMPRDHGRVAGARCRSRPLRTVRAGRSPHTAQASREGVAG
jgi:hypothetical protein